MQSAETETNVAPKPRPLHSALARIAPYLAGHKLRVALIGLTAVCASALAAVEPLALKRLFDRLTDATVATHVMGPVAVLGVVLLTREFFAASLERLVCRVRLATNFSLLSAAVDRLHTLPLSFHRSRGSNLALTRLERGISGATAALADLLVQLLPSLAYLALSLVVMFELEWRLALSVLVLAPLPAIVGAFAAREQVSRERRFLSRWTRAFARFNEVLNGILVVKSFAMEDREKRRFLRGVSEANAIALEGVRADSRTTAAKNASMALARLIALAFGGYLVLSHEVGVGTLIAFVGYLSGLFQPVQTLTGTYQTLKRASVALETVISVLETEDTLGDAPGARELGHVEGHVEFRDVGFEYRKGKRVLDGVSFSAEPGEVVALVGPSGAGKSTLMALLQRLYEPTRGSILIDGEDVRRFKQRSLRRHIGVVMQEATLFSDSIRNNIAFGVPEASEEQIGEAARAANAHHFIERLPQGYETHVGDRGSGLSGGERQRIAIARALLKDAPILVLDEATSALDPESEAEVKEALSRLEEGRTTFVVAHRLSTVLAADRIVVLKDGRVEAIGTHQELERKNAYYASLVARQRDGVLPEAA
jgi:ATP-binding cassette subfamily B protein